MSYPIKLTKEQANRAFVEHGSIAAAARALGVADATVKRHLENPKLARTNLSDAEKERIRRYYEETHPDQFDLVALGLEMGRTRQLIARYAGEIGLTKRGRRHRPEVRKQTGRKIAEKIAANGHPRGMLGKTHTSDTKSKIAAKSSSHWEVMKSTGTGLMSEESRQASSDRMMDWRASFPVTNPYSRTKGGVREDIGPMHFRSAWEANYARYLNILLDAGEIATWEYEAETFWFEKIRRGVRSYKPDFRITGTDGSTWYVEVKGWMDAQSKTKLKRMRIYYPKVNLHLVDEKAYRALEKELGPLILGWEMPPKPVRKPGSRPSRAKIRP